MIDGSGVALGEPTAPTAPMALSLGTTTMHIALTARDGLSKTYELAFARGGALLDQLVFGRGCPIDAAANTARIRRNVMRGTAVQALHREGAMQPDVLHAELSQLNRTRLAPAPPTGDWRTALDREHAWRRLELEFLEEELASVRDRASGAPCTPGVFVQWFEDLRVTGPGQGDPLFPWLATAADMGELSWFLKQEVSGEAGFDDLLALAQLRMPEQAKLELARNYWDELGRGSARGMHGPMLQRLSAALELDDHPATIVWEALALANAMVGLAANRRYAYQALGALGVVELTAPARSAMVNEGLRRCGIPAHARQYFALHATLDVRHSEAWNREILGPLVGDRPEVAPWIAEGALVRLEAGRRCFERYRRGLGISTASRAA